MDITCSGSEGTIYFRDMMSVLFKKKQKNQEQRKTKQNKTHQTRKQMQQTKQISTKRLFLFAVLIIILFLICTY